MNSLAGIMPPPDGEVEIIADAPVEGVRVILLEYEYLVQRYAENTAPQTITKHSYQQRGDAMVSFNFFLAKAKRLRNYTPPPVEDKNERE